MTALPKRRGWTVLWIALAVFLVVRTGGRDRGVITDHLEFGRRVFAGEQLYAPFLEAKPLHPVYPPSFGLLTAPFTLVPERAARFGWGALQVGALFVIGWFLADVLRRRRPDLARRTHLLLFLTAVIAARYVLRDTHGGGGNSINLALALAAFASAERGRNVLGALLLGFSLATKPTTALLVPVLLVMGHVRTAIGGAVAAVGFLGVALLVHGRGLEPLERWVEGSVAYGATTDLFAAPHLGFPPFTWMNQCLRCAVARYLGEVPAEPAAEVPGFVQGVGMSADAVAWITRLLGATVLATTLVAAWRRRGSEAGRVAMLAAAFAVSLLLSPISWKAHHVALLPAFFLVMIACVDGSRGARVLAVAYFVLCSAGGEDVVGDAVKEWQQSLYLATLGTIALWLWLLVRRGERALGEIHGPGAGELFPPGTPR